MSNSTDVVWRRETLGGKAEGFLLFNYKTRGIHFLSEDAFYIWRLLQEKTAEEIKGEIGIPSEQLENFAQELKSRGLLSAPETEAEVRGRTEMWRERKFLDAPVFVQYDVTNACNLRCAHCVTSSGDALKDELSTKEALKLIDQLAEAGVFQIGFSGGEALLRRDIFTLLNHTRDVGIRIQITTNATLIDAEMAKKIKKLNPVTVGVSLEGATPESYGRFRGKENFDRAIAGIKNLVREGVPVKIKTAVSRENLNEMEDIIRLAINLGVDAVDMFLLYPMGRASQMKNLALTREEIKLFLEKLSTLRKKYTGRVEVDVDDKPNAFLVDEDLGTSTCGAGVYWAEVLPNGDVVPCIFLSNLKAGNVRNESFAEIWRSNVWEPFRDRRRLKGRCEVCEYKYSCGGGCRANALLMLGDAYGEDVLCFYGV